MIITPSKSTKENRFALWPQWLAAAEVFLIATTLGLTTGWFSPYLAKLSKPDSQLRISMEDASWIASIMWISKPVGAILVTMYVQYIGRKSSTLISGLFFALGWMCFFVENSITAIYAFQILVGIGTGMLFNAFPLYIGEISDPKIRGALVSFILQGLEVGNLLGNTMGAYLDTKIFAALSLVPNFLFLCSFILVPHTPHHLLRHNRVDQAAKSIQWYDRNSDIESETAALQKFIQASRSVTFTDSFRDLIRPINLKPLMTIIAIFGFLQISGLHTLTAYMEIILTKAEVTVVAPANMVIIVSSLGVVSSWIAIYTNDKFGRTVMLTVSSMGVATGLCLWAINYQLLNLGFDNPRLQWISITAAFVYKMSLTIGLVPIPTTLVSEMFAPNVKRLSSCIINVCSAIFAFIGSKTFQPMVDALTKKYVFWIYALVMLLAAGYTIVFVPETKGKSLSEIQELLSTGGKEINELIITKDYDSTESGKLLEIKRNVHLNRCVL